MDWINKRNWISVMSLTMALLALALNIESRIRDRPNVHSRFDKNLHVVFGDTASDEFVPETMQSIVYVVNSGKRGISILDVEAYAINENQYCKLLNVSQTLYREIDFPLNVQTDTAIKLDIDWLLAKTGQYKKYNHRFSLLPKETDFEVRVMFSNGDVDKRRYDWHDLSVIDFDTIREYQGIFRKDEAD